LLGEAYAVTGDSKQAIDLWRTVDTEQGQLEVRRTWYEYVGANQAAAWIAQAAAQIK
jgi:hypothetical protein